jgi:hypothetical protein
MKSEKNNMIKVRKKLKNKKRELPLQSTTNLYKLRHGSGQKLISMKKYL